MKLALITDIHYGVRGDHTAFNENNTRFFGEVFFPYLIEHNIKHVVCLGDLVDRRKFINFNTASHLREDFIDPMLKLGRQFYWILGNHDIYYQDDMSISAASELLNYLYYVKSKGNLKLFHWYTEATEMDFDGTKILFLPWICKANQEKATEMIETTTAQILFGHLELQGFEMYKGVVQQHGEDAATYRKFDIVCSGHYHHRSHSGGIHYLGSHSDFTWADCGDSRGFHVFDVKNRQLDFIQNPFMMYQKIYYDENQPMPIDFSSIEGKFVRLIVKNKNNTERFNSFVTLCESSNPLELKIIDDVRIELNDDVEMAETKDTLTLIREYVAQTEETLNTKKLDKLIIDLYQAAQEQS